MEDRTLLSGGLPYPTPSTVSQLTADIVYANGNAGSYTITLASNTTFDFTSANNSTNGANALPVITGNITIVGNGDTIERTGSTAFRLFDLASGGSLTLENATLTDGRAVGTGVAAEGGGIYSSGILALKSMTLKTNWALGSWASNDGGIPGSGYGGGLYVAGGVVTLSNDNLSHNAAGGGNGADGGSGGSGFGGGLYVAGGTVTLINDTLRSNGAGGGGGWDSGSGGSGGNGYGGGLDVAAGTVTLSNDTLSGNVAEGGNGVTGAPSHSGGSGGSASGGGLYVAGGTVTLNNDTLSKNFTAGGVGGYGGAGSPGTSYHYVNYYYNSSGALSYSYQYSTGALGGGSGGSGGSTSGGGLYVAGGTVTLNNDTLSDNFFERGSGSIGGYGAGGRIVHIIKYYYPSYDYGSTYSTFFSRGINGSNGTDSGGGIYVGSGSVVVNDCFLSENGADSGNTFSDQGGGIANEGTLTVNNTTLYGNTASDGGGIYNNSSAAATLSNATLAGNTASTGGGIDIVSGDVLLHNTLIAGNLASGNPSDVSGILDGASDYNLIGGNPLLAPLGNYGGPTQTMALLPGSPAIDAGSSAYGGSTDQRGESRVGATDIGAFESQGFAIAIISGNNQSTAVNTAFSQPLVVSVTANNPTEPVAGGLVTFAAPASGSSAVLSGSPAAIDPNGEASITATANAELGIYTASASATGVASPARFSLRNGQVILVTTLSDENDPNDGTTSLREAISYAETQSGPQIITFDPSILTKTSGNIIDLLSALPDLTGDITIEGPGANVLTVQRDASGADFSVFTVDAEASDIISGLTISGGLAWTDGGGIDNLGSLTLIGSTLSGNTALYGGAIYNAGSMTVSACTLVGNSAVGSGGMDNGDGGGIDNFFGSLTVIDSTLSGNSAYFGGGIFNTGGSLTVSGSVLSGNSAVTGGGIWSDGNATVSGSTLSGNTGGGIFNDVTGSLTVIDSTLSGNTSPAEGAGIFNNEFGTLTVSDSTLSNNSAGTDGGGIFNMGSVTVSNSTLSGNSAAAGGGMYTEVFQSQPSAAILSNATLADNSASTAGGGIDIVSGDVLLHNALIAGNLIGSNPSDVTGSLDSASDYNLIGDGSGGLSTANHNLLGSSASQINPLLAPLGNYGGPTQTKALLPGSPAIDAGSSAYGGITDQRGKPRVGPTDIGAFESQGFTLAVSSGNYQFAAVNTTFAQPLVVSVTANNSVEPVAGGSVTFTASDSGTSAVLSGSPAVIASNGMASVTATANGNLGIYSVSASATGVDSPVSFSLSNAAIIVVTTLSDENNSGDDTTTLREAIAYAETRSVPNIITFDPSIFTKASGNVIDLLSALPDLTGDITIEGPGANVLTVQPDSSAGTFSVFTVDLGTAATISGLTISGGSANSGGGIDNLGSLTVSDSTLSGNSAIYGGGINSDGSLTVSDSTLSGNSAAHGGGINSDGSLTVIGSILSGNSGAGGITNGGTAMVSDSILSGNASGWGGGIGNDGTITVSDCTLSGNSSVGGGGIFNDFSDSSVTVIDSTLSGNTASDGGGGGIWNRGKMTVSYSTLSGNTASYGGGINDDGDLTVSDSILSGNSAGVEGGGIYNDDNLTVSNSTLSGNAANSGGGIYNDNGHVSGVAALSNTTLADNSASTVGGGIDVASGSVLLHNTLIGSNLAAGAPSDVSGSLDSASDYNLISDGSGGLGTANHNLLGSSARPLDPLLAPLGNYGGPTQTMALLPGSPAIDANSTAYGGSTDQRGEPRVGATDIGAFESQGFSIAVRSGNNQSAALNTAFAKPLVVTVTAKNAVEPVAGGFITFTAPASGASAVLTGSPAAIGSAGQASVTATANGTAGSYSVSASAAGIASPASFSLTNSPTYVVTSTADDGSAGTLRDAINQANASGGAITEIDFDIGSAGSAQTINLTSALPALTASGVFINGLSQGGSGNTKLLISLNGSGAGDSDGLLLQGSNCTVSGLTLENFGNNGIEVEGPNDTIGGSVLGAGNVISGNSQDGVLLDSTASGTVVQGNSIGVNAAGATEANGGYGISIAGPDNTIGGTVYRAINIIAGNSKDGVLLASSASGNLLLGNLIGVNASGNTVANSVGVEVAGTNNTIGGVASGSRNIISGNSHDGVLLDNTASGNLVLGNYIGTNLYGTAALGNGSNGIEVSGNGNTLGGTAQAARNVIAASSNDGVLLDSGARGNQLLGNYIGTDTSGMTAVANAVGIEDAGNNNTLGGSVLGARNIISGNSGDGVVLDSGAMAETLQGNFMGLNEKGTAALANGGNGGEIQGTNNTIGGNGSSNYYARNFLSGNGNDGMLIDSGATGNVVQGNFIGLDITGTHGAGNVGNGIELAGKSNTLGGTVSGLGNTISGNTSDGVLLDSTASANLLAGNDIGTDYSGRNALGNNSNGIEVRGVNNTLGGTTAGAGNIIAANSNNGVQIDSNASGTLVQGNYIGTNAAGGSLGNGANGVSIIGDNNTIGGNAYRAANTIANNSGDGVLVNGGTGNSLLRNSILGNTGLGISLTNGGNNNVAAPSITSASYSGGTLTVDVTYDAPLANVSYAIELFASPGSGEGAVYLGTITLTPKSTGTQSFTYKTATAVVGSNPIITATITDSSGDTSEFSPGISA